MFLLFFRTVSFEQSILNIKEALKPVDDLCYQYKKKIFTLKSLRLLAVAALRFTLYAFYRCPDFINSYTEKSHFSKNMCKCVFYRIYEFTTTLATFKSKTGRIAQPITDAADTTGFGFATCLLTSSYNNYYYYITLAVKLYGCHL